MWAVYRQMCVQPDCERRALADSAVDVDSALVPLDDAVDDRESQACALSKRFGCEEWAEYLIDVLWWYARTRVLHFCDH